jgi:hypothetical protein
MYVLVEQKEKKEEKEKAADPSASESEERKEERKEKEEKTLRSRLFVPARGFIGFRLGELWLNGSRCEHRPIRSVDALPRHCSLLNTVLV